MADWEYDEASRRYRHISTGRYLSASSSVALRDDVVSRFRSEADALASKLADQTIDVQTWEREMQRAVKEVQSVQYAFGRGGMNAMAAMDRTALAELVTAQNTYLRGFAQAVADGTLSEAQIAARSKLYYGASRSAYERGRASAFNVQLPAHPCDGSTPCKSNCTCFWSLVDKPDTVEATWRTTASESCSVCRGRARRWSPLVIAKASDGRTARLWRAVA